MTAPSRPADEAGRVLWIDVAKGVCILLVVLHHAAGKDLAIQAPATLESVATGWAWVTTALKPVRMPLFFVLSGLVASSAVHRPWAQARRRVLAPYYLYVVWLVLQGAFFSVERLLPMNRTQDLGELLGDLVWASTGLWFLYALAVYFAVARLLARLPRGPVLLVSATFSASAGLLPIDAANRVSVLFHFTFFAVGALAPDLVRRTAALTAPRAGRLAALYLAVVLLLPLLHLPRTVDLVLASAIGVPMGIGICVQVAAGPVAPLLAWVGRRTLPVYVLHAPLLGLALHVSSPIGTGWRGAVDAALYPVLLTAVAVTAALALQAVLRWAGADVLFELPKRLAVPAPHQMSRRATRQGATRQATVGSSS